MCLAKSPDKIMKVKIEKTEDGSWTLKIVSLIGMSCSV